MTVRALVCPSCGAPVPEHAWKTRVTCTYCHATVMIDTTLVNASDLLQMEKAAKAGRSQASEAGARDDVEHVQIGESAYRLHGLIANGESSDVFWATRMWPSELVVLKILRTDDAVDVQRLAHEAAMLKEIAAALASRPGLARRVPRLVQHGRATRANGPSHHALAVRASSGFVHTFDDLRNAAPFAARHLVWLWRRVLEVLGGVHDRGIVHGAITPAHLLVHARDHGVNLVGWSTARPAGSQRTEISPAIEAVAGDVASRPLTPAVDLMMSARSVLFAAGAGEADIPAPLKTLLNEVASGEGSATAELVERQLVTLAKDLYGPPSYEKLVLPGWR